MRHILLTFILSLIPLSAQAIIPLDVAAEFQLPQNPTLWEVQHWMDDESYGYAYIRHDTLYYAPRIGDPIRSFEFPQALIDSADWWGQDYEAIHLHRLASRPNTPILSLAMSINVNLFPSSDYDIYSLFYMFDLDLQELIYYHRQYSGNFSDADGWNSTQTTLSVESWPPPPAYPRRIYRLNRYSTDFEGPGTDRLVTSYRTAIFDVTQEDISLSRVSGMCDVIPESNGNLATLDCYREVTEYDEVYGSSAIGMYNDSSHVYSSLLVCNSGPPCLEHRPIAFSEAFGAPSYVSGNMVVNLESLTIVDTLDNMGEFSLRLYPGGPEMLWWDGGAENHALNPITGEEDTTDNILGGFKSVIKNSDGTGVMVYYESLSQPTNRIMMLRPSVCPQNLIITYLPQHNYIWLAWDPVPGATAYRVCRMFDYNEVGNCDDVFTVTTTATQFTIDPNRPQEFYTVSAVFE